MAALLATVLLAYVGVLRCNYPSRVDFPIRGVDVSHHQGHIDWRAVVRDGIAFAFIKATEGTDHRDTRFQENWRGAGAADLTRGAYHFFTFCSPGENQAENFLAVLPRGVPMLSPVVDVEFVGNCSRWPGTTSVRAELRAMIVRVAAVCHCQPILYVTHESYKRIIAGAFDEYPIWERSVYGRPSIGGWKFWQYADRGHVDGVNGFVDLNVFRGDKDDFGSLMVSNKQ